MDRINNHPEAPGYPKYTRHADRDVITGYLQGEDTSSNRILRESVTELLEVACTNQDRHTVKSIARTIRDVTAIDEETRRNLDEVAQTRQALNEIAATYSSPPLSRIR